MNNLEKRIEALEEKLVVFTEYTDQKQDETDNEFLIRVLQRVKLEVLVGGSWD